jgi:hypothetical protein
MLKKSLVLSFAAGAAISAVALADNPVDWINVPVARANGKVYRANTSATNRAVGNVYNSSTGGTLATADSCGGNVLLQVDDAIDDVQLTGSAVAGTKNILLTNWELRFGAANMPPGTSVVPEFIQQVYIYKGASFTATPSMRTGSTQVGGFGIDWASGTLDFGTAGGSFVVGNVIDLSTFLGDFGVRVPDDNFFVEYVIFDPTGVPWPQNDAHYGLPLASRASATFSGGFLDFTGGGVSTNNVGRTDSHMGVDVTGATRTALEGGPANALTINATNTPNAWALTTAAPWSTMTNDHIVVTDNKGTCAGKPLALRMTFQGELGATAPTATNLGTISDAGLHTATLSVAASTVNYYKFHLAGDATDNAVQFLDIDTAGSTGDVAIALYFPNGRLAGVHNGFLTNGVSDVALPAPDQVSFGIGRRTAPVNGVQFSGQSGQVFAGDFYLAVGPAGTLFQDGFLNAPGGTAASFKLNFATNTNGTPAAASEAPTLVQDLGALPTTGAAVTSTSGNTGIGGMVWFKFSIPGNAGGCGAGATQYLDVDFSLISPNTADAISYIFDASGNALFVSDDRGPLATDPGAFLPQFSFGAAGPRGPYYPALSAAAFNGGTLSLDAGTYYLAVGENFQNLAPNIDRFHTRWAGLGSGESGNDLTVQVEFHTNAAVDGNCPADLDDGTGTGVRDCGVDINDLLFFLAAYEAGSLTADLDDGSFTGTRDGGVDINDLLFFLSHYEGGC